MNSLFGPLGVEYCNLFLVFSVLNLFMFFVTVVGAIVMWSNKKNSVSFVSVVRDLVVFTILYLQNRLLYNMCNKAH